MRKLAGLAKAAQEVTDKHVEVDFVDQGFTDEEPASAAKAQGITLQVVKRTSAKRGFVLLPRRWVVERSFGWMSGFRRFAKDYECLARPPWSGCTSSPLFACSCTEPHHCLRHRFIARFFGGNAWYREVHPARS